MQKNFFVSLSEEEKKILRMYFFFFFFFFRVFANKFLRDPRDGELNYTNIIFCEYN